MDHAHTGPHAGAGFCGTGTRLRGGLRATTMFPDFDIGRILAPGGGRSNPDVAPTARLDGLEPLAAPHGRAG